MPVKWFVSSVNAHNCTYTVNTWGLFLNKYSSLTKWVLINEEINCDCGDCKFLVFAVSVAKKAVSPPSRSAMATRCLSHSYAL